MLWQSCSCCCLPSSVIIPHFSTVCRSPLQFYQVTHALSHSEHLRPLDLSVWFSFFFSLSNGRNSLFKSSLFLVYESQAECFGLRDDTVFCSLSYQPLSLTLLLIETLVAQLKFKFCQYFFIPFQTLVENKFSNVFLHSNSSTIKIRECDRTPV